MGSAVTDIKALWSVCDSYVLLKLCTSICLSSNVSRPVAYRHSLGVSSPSLVVRCRLIFDRYTLVTCRRPLGIDFQHSAQVIPNDFLI